MKKVMITEESTIDLIDTTIAVQVRFKVYGDWLPDKFECPEASAIQIISFEELRSLIGGVK